MKMLTTFILAVILEAAIVVPLDTSGGAAACLPSACLEENGCICASGSSPLPVAETPQVKHASAIKQDLLSLSFT